MGRNLLTVLATLQDQGPAAGGYKSTSSGSMSDTVYGFIQCRGDISAQECSSCARLAVQILNSTVRNSTKGGRIHPGNCFLRYEDHFFSSILDKDTNQGNCSTSIPSSSLAIFQSNSRTALEFLKAKVPRKARKFVAAVAGIGSAVPAYALAKKTLLLAIGIPIAGVLALLLLVIGFFISKRSKNVSKPPVTTTSLERVGYGFDRSGTFSDGTEIAIKKLSVASKQGEQQFLNEVKVIGSLWSRLAGRKNKDASLPEPEQYLLEWNHRFSSEPFPQACQLHSDRLLPNLLHRKLVSSSNNEQARMLVQAIHIALMCTQASPQDRPSMSHVIAMLSGHSNVNVPLFATFDIRAMNPRFYLSSSNSAASDPKNKRQEESRTFTDLEPR
ncbi:hypothetical protein SELMODRAFT_426504 [Selaginella moellendorffii]|uniref:Gnk2-homologous domain-containing protein n=1 Tax=Selaginella moellendorffii TaxID=88036 RepID=D8SWK4_SELML|nr:hypothetical protein SELMODRAFT_426504 [Selaginella moellendorffii]